MSQTNPSEAAAASSPYLSEGMLRAQANPDCAFPDAVQVLSREVLRLRAQCPPTAEVETQAAKRKQIVGELREVINRHSLERAGGDTPDHILAEAMLDTVLAFGERVQKRDAWHGFRPFGGVAFEQPAPVVLGDHHVDTRPTCAHPKFGTGGVVDAPKVGPATGDVWVGPANYVGKATTLDVELRVEDIAKAARKGVADMLVAAGEAAIASIQEKQPKVGPATGQPRTEATLGTTLVGGDGRKIPLVEPDGGVTVLDLGEAFRDRMRVAAPDSLNAVEVRLRHLHAAVAELAKVVERIGAR
jgi:hypothetical protein